MDRLGSLKEFGPGGKMWHGAKKGSYLSGDQGYLPDSVVPPMQGGWGLTSPANQASPTLNNEGFTEYANRKGSAPMPAPSEGMDPREFARGGEGGFDPTDTESVKKMQGMLGVKVDGILGPQTEKALRRLQGVPYQESQSEELGQTDSEGEMEDEYGDPTDSGFDRNINMSKEPNAQAWMQSIDAKNAGPIELDNDPNWDEDFNEEANDQSIVNSYDDKAWMNNANANVSKYEANAQESYYDDFFDEEQNNLNRPYDNNAAMGFDPDKNYYDTKDGEDFNEVGDPDYEKGEERFWNNADIDHAEEYQGYEGPRFVNPALDATSTESINRFMPGSPGNFAEGSGGVGMQYKGNVQNLDMGEAPSQNNITTAMNNERSGEKFIEGQPNENGRYKDSNGQVVQLSEIRDDKGRFMGWGNPEGYEDSLEWTGEEGQYDVGSPYPQPGIPWETEQNVGPYNPQRSRQDILAEFQKIR